MSQNSSLLWTWGEGLVLWVMQRALYFDEIHYFPREFCDIVNPTLVETLLNPTWELRFGTSKDEIERPI